MAAAKGALSPAMQQFFRAKDECPDALVFFRMGDFYEMFYDDAVVGAELLDLTLTSRSKTNDGDSIPMAGIPHHAAATYIARLLEKGQKVAICEQMVDPSQVKGLVPREVVRVITPGLVLDEGSLDARINNYLVVACAQGGVFGLAALELSTSELRATTPTDRTALLTELVRLEPRELLFVGDDAPLLDEIKNLLSRTVVSRHVPPNAAALHAAAEKTLGTEALDDATKTLRPPALEASRIAIEYAATTQHTHALGIRRITTYDSTTHLQLDDAAIRNLELVRTLGGERRGSLLHLLDLTRTSVGARLLRRRLLSPLRNVQEIERRHELVTQLLSQSDLRGKLRGALDAFTDLERLATRVLLGVATPRDTSAIRHALRVVVELSDLLGAASRDHSALLGLVPNDACLDVLEDIATTLVDDPPIQARDGGLIARGVDARIDELRDLSEQSQEVLLALEERERAASGIATLRIGYTRVFGYYFEITKKNLGAVPAHFRRKQTVAGGERFTTEELDTLQGKILNANERSSALEYECFDALRTRVASHAHRLQTLAAVVAEIDVTAALAELAHKHDYTRPAMDETTDIALEGARHPVVEAMLGEGRFVPNDVSLAADRQCMMILTGPNMAGKSTLMRQTALAVVLAQMGAFVPAKRARIGLVDRVFTRVGASDNLAKGQSTFMLEMSETATILREASKRSLVVLDEIGRGTSTYDGLAIAWAVAEHLHDKIGCRTLFATHYHELCALADERKGIVNFNVGAREEKGDIVFLHKLAKGGANRSYGIAVAKLAGVPARVVSRANTLASELEARLGKEHATQLESSSGIKASPQLTLPTEAPAASAPRPSAVLQRLSEVAIDDTTPREALAILAELKSIAEKGV